jgi:hypothetical protein
MIDTPKVPQNLEMLEQVHALFTDDCITVAAAVKATIPESPVTQEQEVVTN